MSVIIPITGATNYTITLDPASWIFDERKIELKEFFEKGNTIEEYEAELEREAKEPPKPKRKKYSRDLWLEKSFVMPLKPFLLNAEPENDAKEVVLELKNGENHTISLDQAVNGVLQFSEDGSALKEDGPAYFYYGDASNPDSPVTGIMKIVVR